jgi:tetratricopeptide (TPR) repeat protein
MALQTYQEIYEIQKHILGPQYPSILPSIGNMARVLSKQGKYEEALQAYKEVYDICKRVLGSEHPIRKDALLAFELLQALELSHAKTVLDQVMG